MGTGYTRNDTGNNIADGNVINASDLDGEFDAIQSAFNASSGHSHDGTTGEGPQIDASGIANNAVALGTKTTGNYVATLTAGALIDLQNNSGEGATPTIDVDLTELTDMTETALGADELVILDGGTAQKRKAISEIPLSIFNNDSSFSSTTGTVTSSTIAAGALIDVTGDTTITSSGTATIAVDLTELTDMSETFASADEFVVLDGGASGAQKRKPASEIPISVFNNDSGFTANVGDITGVTAGTGLSGGGSSGGVTLDLDFSELTDMTGAASGTTEFILQDGTTESRKAASEIAISIFNNDSGFAAGDVTLAGSQSLTNKTIDVDNNTVSNIEVDNFKSGVLDTDISSVAGTDTTLASAKAIKTYVDAQITAQDLDFQGDTGGALSIDLDTETLDIAGGTGIDTSGSSNTLTVAIDSTVATLTGSQSLTNKSLTAPVLSAGGTTTAGSILFKEGTDNGTNSVTLAGPASTADVTVTLPAAATTLAGLAVAQEYTASQNFDEQTLTDGSAIDWNLQTQQVSKVTLGGNRTFNAPSNHAAGLVCVLTIIQDGTGSRTATFNSAYKFTGGTAPTLTTTASARDILVFISDGTNLREIGRSLNFSYDANIANDGTRTQNTDSTRSARKRMRHV